jgi:ribosome modulation factor
LFDSVGHACLIVIAAAEDHTAGIEEVQGEDDQRAMDLGHEYHNNDGGGMSDDDVVDAEFKAIEQQPLQAELDEAYQQGYEAAGDGLGQDACPVMSGPLCIEWVKGWKSWHAEHGQETDETEGAME